MISATLRACVSPAVDRSRRSCPSAGRLRLQLKVAMRIVAARAGAGNAAAGIKPAATSINEAARMRASEVVLQRQQHRAGCADGEEPDAAIDRLVERVAALAIGRAVRPDARQRPAIGAETRADGAEV